MSQSRSFAAAVVVFGLGSAPVLANSILPGFDVNTLDANDDGSVGPVSLGFNFNFFGKTYSEVFINNNGNVTFGAPYSAYTPSALSAPGLPPILAPFFADVDTRGTGSGVVTYGTGSVDGHAAFGVNWPEVGYYALHTDKLNTFQLIIVDRSDIAQGKAEVSFNYGNIEWESGDASGGSGGLGGTCARVGYSNGTGAAGTYYELPGSGVCGALITGGSNDLAGVRFTASAIGDPHFTTYSGVHYNYQEIGDFVLTRSTVDQFEVQVRTRSPYDGAAVTVMSEAAATLCNHKVTFDIDRASAGGGFVWLDGSPISLSVDDPVLTSEGCGIFQSSRNEYRVIWNTGEILDVTNRGAYLDLSSELSWIDLFGPVEGLLSSDLDPDSWRVTGTASLFNLVPEPSTLTLLSVAIGFTGLAVTRSRRT